MMVLAYGVMALGAVLNIPAWTRLTQDEVMRNGWHVSPGLAMRSGLLLSALAISLVAIVRGSETIIGGSPPAAHLWFFGHVFTLPAWFQVTWLSMLGVAEALYLYASAYALREAGRYPICWQLYKVGVLLMIVAELIW